MKTSLMSGEFKAVQEKITNSTLAFFPWLYSTEAEENPVYLSGVIRSVSFLED